MAISSANPITLLLVDLMRCGITIKSDGGKLRYRPCDRMTPDLTGRLKVHKDELLTLLAPAEEAQAGDVTIRYTTEERELLANAPQPIRDTVDAVKATFADMGRATVVQVSRHPTGSRQAAAWLIWQTRRDGNHHRAIALRDAWQKRIQTCTVEGNLPVADAENIALSEIFNLQKETIDNAHL